MQEFIQNNCNPNDFMKKLDLPPKPPRTPSPPPPAPRPRGFTLFANNQQQLLSLDQYCFDSFDMASSNMFPEILTTNYFSTDQLYPSQSPDFGNEQIHSAVFL